MENVVHRLRDMRLELSRLMDRLDIAGRERELADLEKQTEQDGFWNDPQTAQTVMQKQAKLRGLIGRWISLLKQIDDTLELVELGDTDLEAELSSEAEKLAEAVDKASFEAMMGAEHDTEDAILAIHAGAGGVDAQDWAAMLLRMYLRWAELRRLKAEIVEETPGDEAGIKSAMLSISGNYTYGYLKSERGVHRLVRLSPFDAANRRHTSFALVEVWPDIHGDIDIDIDPKDLNIDTFRAGGAGGQHVQKNDTAVRITHVPTGIVVSCQNQRSQTQNKQRAMEVLKSRLYDLERQKQEAQFNALKGDHISAEWGNQIRSYVLHPYQLVKDMRTGYETSQTQRTLDGELDSFMESYLKYKVGT
ncbi:MAG: peptide chain release factor 2 [Anaerolineae bacterium]|nr:peptide chain release factor 2 [Anaerolineae bacterium]